MMPTFKKILYATDLKEHGSRDAYKMAVSLSELYGAELLMLHVMDPISGQLRSTLREALSNEELNALQVSNLEANKGELQKRIDSFWEEEFPSAGRSYANGTPKAIALAGDAGREILETARNEAVDLIVMGTRTHTGLGQLVLGSTANKVIHHSTVPVMVFPL